MTESELMATAPPGPLEYRTPASASTAGPLWQTQLPAYFDQQEPESPRTVVPEGWAPDAGVDQDPDRSAAAAAPQTAESSAQEPFDKAAWKAARHPRYARGGQGGRFADNATRKQWFFDKAAQADPHNTP